MPKTNSSRKPRTRKVQPLSNSEIDRLAERLAAIIENDTTGVSLLMLLIDHLDKTRTDFQAFSQAVYAIKQRLFVGTNAAGEAQEEFEIKAHAERGKLLKFPS